MFLIEQHYLSHSLNIADALIGATAIIYGIPLLSRDTQPSGSFKSANDSA